MIKNTLKELGISSSPGDTIEREYIQRYIIMRLTGLAPFEDLVESKDSFLNIAQTMIKNFRERERLYRIDLSPSDTRIQKFINNYFARINDLPKMELPSRSFTLDFHGIARELSLPLNENYYASEYVQSYRIKQGVLHNPKSDRRTTKGVFHVAEGGLPIPSDKKATPMRAAAYILSKALKENGDIMKLPYTAKTENPVKTWVSLLLRPLVCPEVPGITPEKSMEVRFFVPGSLVSNLDFVESIFGNGGSPYHFFNDAGLDVEHWTGHTGCVILAPQLTTLTKKECGLPHVKDATERQKRDGMCWEKETELYNDGSAYKLTLRTEEGIIVTVIADNYFGYSKKEVKTQISFAANLFGNCEEEHAGGAYVFPSYNQGDKHIVKVLPDGNTFKGIAKEFGDIMDILPEGYGVDKRFPNIIYVPENSVFDLVGQTVSWTGKDDAIHKIKFLPKKHYVLPNGSKFRMEKVPGTQNYRLVETNAEGTLFHKPCTVSGGGKSEISKSISDSIFTGSFFVKDFEKDMEQVKGIIDYDYSLRFKNSKDAIPFSRSFLSTRRSMGSVIKLLTPSPDFTDAYNQWLENVPQYIKGIAFIVKRFYQESWGDNWKERFSVDILNGQLGNELKYNNKKLVARYLRVGFDEKNNWRTFKLRQDFVHASKVQMEDDITASIVFPCPTSEEETSSVKFIQNCEYRFFQRPDEAIVRGFDKKAEEDLASPQTFISNFEPLAVQDAKDIVDDTINFEKFTEPMHDFILDIAENESAEYFVSSSHPRIVDGKPTKNSRYLQVRSSLLNPIETYLVDVGLRFARNLPMYKPLYTPVQAVLPGRRNNPAEKGIRPLAVYNPLHYQELPELFMDFISSLTGKSPSTTGAGSEGALTKAPFNALLPITDVNNALISYILTGYPGFTTPAGYIGSKLRIDHDISLLMPELLARLQPHEKNPDLMIAGGFMEKISDFKHKNKTVRASVLGYRITSKFVNTYFGRVFENPDVVFTDEILRPELQSMDEFVDGINNIVETQQKVAKQYFEDGSYELAIPPLKALLNIMAHGVHEGKTLDSKEIRDMFTYEYLIESDFYAERLTRKQIQDVQLWENHIHYLENTLAQFGDRIEGKSKNIILDKIKNSKEEKERISSYDYLKKLKGCLGRDKVDL